MSIYISICIPTKGRIEIVKETLDSIFKDNDVEYSDFEVVLSDNSDNDQLKDLLDGYKHYPNIVYNKTTVKGFFNSINALQMGNGYLLKLHNDYTRFNKFAIRRMVDFAKAEMAAKPLVYFSNNELKTENILRYDSFDKFNYELSFLATWSTGFAIWKEDFDNCSKTDLNKIFPHTTLLYKQHYKNAFVINDEKLFTNEIIYTKGGYNLFQAFSVQYLNMVENLYKDKQLSEKTFNHIKSDLFNRFIITWYAITKVAKNSYTYDLTGIKQSVTTYYSVGQYYYMIGMAHLIACLKQVKKTLLPGK